MPADAQPRIEKSIRPSANGLSEIWYEFSGVTFDVEVRSDGRAHIVPLHDRERATGQFSTCDIDPGP